MPGNLPASGALTMDMLNTYAGFASGTQVALGGSLARLYAGKLTTDSAISMNDLYGRGVDFTLTLASSFGNNVYTPYLYLDSYFTADQLPTGGQFFVTARCVANWTPDNPNPTVTFTKGTAATFTYPKSNRKSYNLQVIYDGANSVRARGYYSGDPTDFPNGTVYLDRVRIVL